LPNSPVTVPLKAGCSIQLSPTYRQAGTRPYIINIFICPIVL